jgi:hypothetical protein
MRMEIQKKKNKYLLTAVAPRGKHADEVSLGGSFCLISDPPFSHLSVPLAVCSILASDLIFHGAFC